ncbi:hypothetical protein N7488_003448 [Penicillium malachiteum]|nr:hypothetical protein N7488_003448 [Penicillium malachiteum]
MAQQTDPEISPSSEGTLTANSEKKTKPPSISDSSESDQLEDSPISGTVSSKSETPQDDAESQDVALSRTLSQRKSHASGHEGKEWEQIERLISRMFGNERQANSEEEKTRHAGVVWKGLTVKGVGLGAALQPTNGDIFLGIPRLIKRLLTRGRKGTGVGKPELRTILDDFTGCVRPGEMLLVLGRPGSGCSTFLKVIGNQRYGYESIEGDVKYGATDSETMAKSYRSEVSYNPEDDLHYATLTVRDTLLFALKTRTPDQPSRIPGETRKEYQQTFLSAIAKLFWIEHAMGTKIGNELIRGVSGGDVYKATLADIDDFENEMKSQEHERELARQNVTTKNYTVPFWKQVMILTHRQFLVMFGDRAALAGKWGVIVFQALIVGSLFYNLPNTSSGIFTRGGVMFFILLFNALLALAELTAAFESRPILMKHKSFSFYRPAAYALAQVVVDVPLVFIQVVLFDLIHGQSCTNSISIFHQFVVHIYANHDDVFLLPFLSYSYHRSRHPSLDCIYRQDCPDQRFSIAYKTDNVHAGYLIPPWKMHPWLKWLIWINPVQYAFEALMANEFYDLAIQCETPYIVPAGSGAQSGHQSCAIQGSTPNELTVQGADYIKAAYTYSRSHLWRNFGIIVGWFIFFVVLTMIGMEIQKPNKGGSSVTVFKRGEAPKAVEDAIQHTGPPVDIESTEEKPPPSRMADESSEHTVQEIARNTSIFTWQNVNYTIPYKGGQRKLLQNVSGYVKPGRLTALMGASGAGKTTLLNALAQRINYGVITGDFLVDGNPLPKSFQRATGFAEQMDIHEPTATVRESLRFSALLRQPKEVPLQEKYDYCEKVIDLLEMRSIAGATVGSAGSGLNQEQRKRLTIAYMLEVIGAGNPGYDGQDWGEVWAKSTESKNLSMEINDIISSRRGMRIDGSVEDDREYAMPLYAQIMAVTRRTFVAYWRLPDYIIGKFMLHIFTGLFNTFTFWHLGNSYIDMQSRLFSIFMTLTISPPLIQQLQPRYLHSRGLYESRESNSKIYSWSAFVVSTILPELPYSIVAGSIYFNCWYWGVWFPRDSFSSGYTWMMLMLFECYYVGFGQFIAALAPNELFASILVPAFFMFVVSFCGVVVPYVALPHFWQSWMYWLTPFHYLLEGLMGVLTHNIPVRCVEREEAHFSPPSGMTCQQYAGGYAREAGGYVRDAANGMCAYCQYSSGDEFAAGFNVFYAHKWRDYGIFWAYVVFNFMAVFAFSWLYLHGVRDVKRWFSTRKTKKMAHHGET